MTAEPAPHLRVVQDPKVEALQREVAKLKRMLAAATVDIGNLETELRAKRSEIKRLRAERDDKDKADPSYETALKLWEFWRQHCRPGARKFSPEQFRAVRARLADCLPDSEEPAYGPRYIAEAILGAKYDAYVDAKGKVFNDLELVCRTPAKLEGFHERYERAKSACER